MSKAPENTPEVLRFTAAIAERDGKTFIELPGVISAKVDGMVKLEGVINSHPFRSSVVDGCLRVNVAMLRGSHAGVGDVVELSILGPEPEAVLPADLAAAMILEAMEVWDLLTSLGRHDWVRWIEGAKKPETRTKRIARMVEQLSEGKRRACCVDVNSYMMECIEKDNFLRR